MMGSEILSVQGISDSQSLRKPVRFQKILGIRFLIGSAQDAYEEAYFNGGLVVVPSAPMLKDAAYDPGYREALLGADFAIADSTLMVLLWNLVQGDCIPKLSGLRYLRFLLTQPQFRRAGSTYWVMPSAQAEERNRRWLNRKGIPVTVKDLYLAPIYGTPIDDRELLCRLEQRRPAHIVIALGGGTQERLGLYLKRNLSYRPTIHCIGAAIAFLSGDQVRIPVWADALGLGWLLRSLSNPKRFLPRYWEARRLAHLLIRYRDRLPQTLL